MTLVPPDTKRCQAMVTTGGPFQMGGAPGNPKDGYRRRCDNAPKYIATERSAGADGLCGSMSLCAPCKDQLIKQLGEGFASFEEMA